MIRRAIRDTPPLARPLLREAYDEPSIRRNQIILFQHAVSFVPSEAAQMVRILRIDQQMKRVCKLLLLRKCIPLDLFDSLYPYFYDTVTYSNSVHIPSLPHRVFSRTIHHLIRTERVADVPLALEIGKQFDVLDREQFNQNYNPIMRDFRKSLWRCMSHANWYQLIGNATPEIWYLQGTYACWWLWWD
jgi:hypothetical protein